MRWLLTPILWMLAVLVALGVLWRLWRGHHVVLRGRWTPRFVRMVVIVLVVLGAGADKADAAPVLVPPGGKKKTDEPLPATITTSTLTAWAELQSPRGSWMQFKRIYTSLSLGTRKPADTSFRLAEQLARSLPQRFRGILLDDLEAREKGKVPAQLSVGELTATLDELEREGYIDPWATAYLWRRSAGALDRVGRQEVIDLFVRLHRHARLANTLTLARAQGQPLLLAPRAWMSKGGPSRLVPPTVNTFAIATLLAAARELYPKSNTGTWERDALARFTLARGSASVTVIRGGRGQVPQAEGELRFGRLDLLETTPGDRPVVLEHATLGRIELPPGKLFSVWDLAAHLPEKATTAAKQLVQEALEGKLEAAHRLEQSLPLTYAFVHAGLAASPRAPGAPRLRLILTQFDEVPAMPVDNLIDYRPHLYPTGGGRGRLPPR
jgi:hypothetical protein